MSRSLKERIGCKAGIHLDHVGQSTPLLSRECRHCDADLRRRAREHRAVPTLARPPQPANDDAADYLKNRTAFWLYPDRWEGVEAGGMMRFDDGSWRPPTVPTIDASDPFTITSRPTSISSVRPRGLGCHCWSCKRVFVRGEVDPERWPVVVSLYLPGGPPRERLICRGCLGPRNARRARELSGPELAQLYGDAEQVPEPECGFCRTGTISHRDGRCWVCRRAPPRPKPRARQPMRPADVPRDPYGNPLRLERVGERACRHSDLADCVRRGCGSRRRHPVDPLDPWYEG